MWRYGIGGPPAKKKKTESELSKRERDNSYDVGRRTRAFQENWLQSFKWLEYNSETNEMFCSICKMSKFADTKSVFVTGSNNFKMDSIKAHASSVPHMRSVEIDENLKKEPSTSEASKALISLQGQNKDRLIHLFRTAHALAKNARPFTDFVWHCNLDEKKGIDIGQTYRTDKACKEFTSFISKACLEQLISDINEARCFSLICDESTDCSIMEELIIYVVFCYRGKLSIKFLNMYPLNKANAEAIYLALKETCVNLLKFEKPFEKLLCFAADGAATMQGAKTGVGQRLAIDQPHLLKIHCMAHRLELAFEDTIKVFKDFHAVEELLLRLFKFYHNSPANRAQLNEACKSLNLKELVPTRVGGTRWLPHLERALTNFFIIFDAILLQLENCFLISKTESASIAKGLLDSMKSQKIIRCAVELSEVVNCLTKVSLTLQNRNTTLFHAYNSVSTVVDFLNNLKDDKQKIEKKLAPLSSKLKCSEKRNLTQVKNLCKFNNFVDAIIMHLKKRFPDMNPHLLSVSKILTLVEWPMKPCPVNFGKEEINALVLKYETVLQNLKIKTSNVEFEWASLLKNIYSSNVDPQQQTWESINSQFHIGHEHILALLDIVQCIPCTSVEAERGFRNLRDIKSDWRNKLSAETLTDLMRVYLNTPDIENFDPVPAISLWLQSGQKTKKVTLKPCSQK